MKLLYKYVSNADRILEDGYIRATQLSALNDPFEAFYCQEGLRKLASHFDPELRNELIDYVEEHKHKVGVISLTEAKDNLLMWSHYGNEHKGVSLGFYTENPVESHPFVNLFKLSSCTTTSSWDGYGDQFQGLCLPVKYRKQPRYRVDTYDFDYSEIDTEGADRILFEIFQQKSDEWIYEKEHRITLRLEQADKVIVCDLDKIRDQNVLSQIKGSEFCDEIECEGVKHHVIFLNKIKNDVTRESFSSCLAGLSKNSNNLYLFQLNKRSLSSVIFGYNFDYTSKPIGLGYFDSLGFVDMLTTGLNNDFYALNFFERDEV